MTERNVDILIIGAGILGLAVGYKLLLKHPHLKILIIEKEKGIAQHQTGHNSGVIHSGIYYKPGSLKATNCIDGAKQLLNFCKQENIPVDPCGKLIVAKNGTELSRLDELYRRGIANGVQDLNYVTPEQIQEIEPLVKNCLKGLYSPHTSIVDYLQVAKAFLRKIEEHGGTLLTETASQKIVSKGSLHEVETNHGTFTCKQLVNCAGVWADDVARQANLRFDERIIPFRGEYYRLKESVASKIKGLIYPVPDPEFPFLGVHLTRMIRGGVEAGPNAVLALAKNGYSHSDIDVQECVKLLGFPGFWKMAGNFWQTGVYEFYRSLSRKAFLKSLQELTPELVEDDLLPGGAGVRSQLVKADGILWDDFCLLSEKGMVHVLNAPSPAATACLSIADKVICMANIGSL